MSVVKGTVAARGKAGADSKAPLLPQESSSNASSKASQNDSDPSAKQSQTDKETTLKESARAGQTSRENGAKPQSSSASSENEFYPNPFPDQCGFKDDGSKCSNWKAPPRITATRATPDQQAKYQGIIDSILHNDTLVGKRIDFDPNDVMLVMIRVQLYFGYEPVLIEDVPFGVTIVGDLHGQLYDLNRIFKIHEKDGKPGYLNTKYLFLGDYVDRGKQSLEVLMLLFCLKILYPDNFFLLRGNHEFVDQNWRYGLGRELDERYNEATSTTLFGQINETFCWMSICAIVGNSYFCAHAGISPRAFTRAELRGLSKPIVSDNEDVVIKDIVWSDNAVGLKGTVFNFDRGTSVYFGLDALVHALSSVECIALFRGHSRMDAGFDNQWDVCFTVFSATACAKSNNDGAVAVIDEQGKVHVHILKVDERRVALLDELYGIEEDNDAITVDDGNGTGQAKVL